MLAYQASRIRYMIPYSERIKQKTRRNPAFSERFCRLAKVLPVREDIESGEQGVRRHVFWQPVGAGERGAFLFALRPARESEEHQIALFDPRALRAGAARKGSKQPVKRFRIRPLHAEDPFGSGAPAFFVSLPIL